MPFGRMEKYMRIAVITGASAGLGREYARAAKELYQNLDEIWVIARRKEKLEELKEELGEKVRPLVMDITSPTAAEEYVTALKENDAEVVLLINNAGFGKLGNFDELSTADNAGMVRLNCEALTVWSSITLPFMKAGGEIVNSCSIASFVPNTRMAVYCSTKAYVMSLSRCMREELKRRKINVLAACPGPMDTEFLSLANITKGASRTFDTLPRVNPRNMAVRSLKASQKKRGVYTDRLFYKFYRVLAKVLPHRLVMLFSGT